MRLDTHPWKIMFCSRVSRTEVESYHPTFLDMGSGSDGSIEVLV